MPIRVNLLKAENSMELTRHFDAPHVSWFDYEMNWRAEMIKPVTNPRHAVLVFLISAMLAAPFASSADVPQPDIDATPVAVLAGAVANDTWGAWLNTNLTPRSICVMAVSGEFVVTHVGAPTATFIFDGHANCASPASVLSMTLDLKLSGAIQQSASPICELGASCSAANQNVCLVGCAGTWKVVGKFTIDAGTNIVIGDITGFPCSNTSGTTWVCTVRSQGLVV
jgi:hypothetical protein